MDIKNNAMLAWGVAAVLAVVILAMVVMEMRESIGWGDVRDRLEKECGGTDEESRADCLRSLGRLEDMLIEVNRGFSESPATGTPAGAP